MVVYNKMEFIERLNVIMKGKLYEYHKERIINLIRLEKQKYHSMIQKKI
jgi:hypothetical protein